VTSTSRRITDTGPSYLKFGAFDFPRRRDTTSPLIAAVVSVDTAAMAIMKPSPTDNDPPPHRWRNLLPLTGLTASQIHTVCTLANQRRPPAAGCPWDLPLPVRALLVLIHLRTNLTTRALAALFDTSQPTADRVLHHLVPVLARALRPNPDNSNLPWIIDGTLIPVHNQSMTAISKNYRRSVNTQIIICSHRHRVVVVGRCWPGNRNDVIVARHTVAHPLDSRDVLGDGGDRGIASIITHGATAPATSSMTTTTAIIDASEPGSNTSSPDSKTGKSFGNAAAAANPSTTASKSSPDSGTSRPTPNYG
jgi:hypothetical protein